MDLFRLLLLLPLLFLRRLSFRRVHCEGSVRRGRCCLLVHRLLFRRGADRADVVILSLLFQQLGAEHLFRGECIRGLQVLGLLRERAPGTRYDAAFVYFFFVLEREHYLVLALDQASVDEHVLRARHSLQFLQTEQVRGFFELQFWFLLVGELVGVQGLLVERGLKLLQVGVLVLAQVRTRRVLLRPVGLGVLLVQDRGLGVCAERDPRRGAGLLVRREVAGGSPDLLARLGHGGLGQPRGVRFGVERQRGALGLLLGVLLEFLLKFVGGFFVEDGVWGEIFEFASLDVRAVEVSGQQLAALLRVVRLCFDA